MKLKKMPDILYRFTLADFLFILAVFGLALGWIGHMPVFKRYYLADLPGMAWTGDYLLINEINLASASLAAFLIPQRIMKYYNEKHRTDGNHARVRLINILFAGFFAGVLMKIIATGMGLNLPRNAIFIIDMIYMTVSAAFILGTPMIWLSGKIAVKVKDKAGIKKESGI